MSNQPNIIPHVYNNVLILQRGDGYWNATAMCQANGKRWNNYLRNQETEEFLAELAQEVKMPVARFRATGTAGGEVGLVDTVQGGPPALQGTWVHRRVGIDLARWRSPKFAVKVNAWVDELLTTGRVELAPVPPLQPRPWSTRLEGMVMEFRARLANRHPDGGWAVAPSLVVDLLVLEDELFHHGFPADVKDLPDGSVGKRWRNHREGQPWARDCVRDCALETPHCTDDGKVLFVFPFIYHPAEHPYFQRWFNLRYVPEHMPEYFQRKFRKTQPLLAVASVADHACRRIVDRPARLPARTRQQLTAAGGFVHATALLPGPGGPVQRDLPL
jgi:hypothetical protein